MVPAEDRVMRGVVQLCHLCHLFLYVAYFLQKIGLLRKEVDQLAQLDHSEVQRARARVPHTAYC